MTPEEIMRWGEKNNFPALPLKFNEIGIPYEWLGPEKEAWERCLRVNDPESLEKIESSILKGMKYLLPFQGSYPQPPEL